jgi:hypothetical protein
MIKSSLERNKKNVHPPTPPCTCIIIGLQKKFKTRRKGYGRIPATIPIASQEEFLAGWIW